MVLSRVGNSQCERHTRVPGRLEVSVDVWKSGRLGGVQACCPQSLSLSLSHGAA